MGRTHTPEGPMPRLLFENVTTQICDFDNLSCHIAVEDVMKRWRSIRDQYRRERQQRSRSGDAGHVKRKYIYYDRLNFLAPILALRPTQSNLTDRGTASEAEPVIDPVGDEVAGPSSPPTRRMSEEEASQEHTMAAQHNTPPGRLLLLMEPFQHCLRVIPPMGDFHLTIMRKQVVKFLQMAQRTGGAHNAEWYKKRLGDCCYEERPFPTIVQSKEAADHPITSQMFLSLRNYLLVCTKDNRSRQRIIPCKQNLRCREQ
ncbi:uncharacterized protein [Dendrobates tinctorius]|uniref:uncharacterized protein n=1 Tax=Dendrobates tinctorius TaxID=92724 RepID=UPI003CC9D9E3